MGSGEEAAAREAARGAAPAAMGAVLEESGKEEGALVAAMRGVCRGAWARVTIDQCRRLAVQTVFRGIGHQIC